MTLHFAARAARTPLRVVLMSLFAMTAMPAAADTVTTWMRIGSKAVDTAAEADPRWRTVETTRLGPKLGLAMFEAANAVDRRYESYLGVPAAVVPTSADAAVAAAAHAVLTTTFPSQAKSFDDAMTIALSQVADGPAEAAGVELGKRLAAQVLARTTLPADAKPEPYRPLTSPGAYIDPRLPSIQPFDTLLPPFFLKSAAELRPGPPPALTSERYARDLDEVRRLGGRASTERTAAQGMLARPWLMVDVTGIVADFADRPGRTLVQNARLFALVEMAAEDTWLAIMEAKMHYGTWRPVTAIRNADQDGNDATARDAGWESHLPTPTHPDYPCGHCGNAAAYAAVLASDTGEAPAGGIRLYSHENAPGMTVTLATWKSFVDEMSMSRIYAGAHTRFANDAAEEMGREVARRALAGWMRPLPGK